MPFKSKAQRKWMHANEPEMAAKWEKHTPKGKSLPNKVKEKTMSMSKAKSGADKKKPPKLVRGAKARTRKGFAENMAREKDLGKSKKRQEGTAYGEAYLGIDKLEKKAAKRKKAAAKKSSRK